jgi:SAM-dependent methyltransferase
LSVNLDASFTFEGARSDFMNKMFGTLVDLLWCPSCNGDLTVDVGATSLVCTGCQKYYKICGNVIVFDIGAEIPQVESFSRQWKKFRATQFNTRNILESQLRFETETRLGSLKGKVVCEYGVGAGRFMKEALLLSPCLAIGIDASDSVFVTSDNLKEYENLFLLKADILNSPIRPNSLDVAYCIGVLHHIVSPIAAFLAITRSLKKGGVLALSVYENNLFERPNKNSVSLAFLEVLWSLNLFRAELFRSICCRLPPNVMMAYCLFFVPFLHFLNKVPIIRYFRYLVPSTCYRGLPVEWSMCDTMDTYATKVVHQYRAKTIFQWFKAAQYSSIDLLNSRAGWVAVRGVKDEEVEEAVDKFESVVEPPIFDRR